MSGRGYERYGFRLLPCDDCPVQELASYSERALAARAVSQALHCWLEQDYTPESAIAAGVKVLGKGSSEQHYDRYEQCMSRQLAPGQPMCFEQRRMVAK